MVQSYTQYIPLPISDLDSWLKTPSIYVFDCSAAGMIVNAFTEVLTVFVFILSVLIYHHQEWYFSFSFHKIHDVHTLNYINIILFYSFTIPLDQRGTAFCLQHVNHMKLFPKELNFLQMFLPLALQHQSRWPWDGELILIHLSWTMPLYILKCLNLRY